MTVDPTRSDPAAGIVGEEAIIQEFLAPLAAGYAGAHGLLDDCAAVAVPPGHDLVVKTDPIRAGVHFFADDPPADIAWKALAVNVSDLVAKGATPIGYLMSLSLPDRPTRQWLSSFARGLRAAQTAFGMHLIGGDTDKAPGPLSIAVTAFGRVPAGRMPLRTAARPGDVVFVSGTIGDAGLGLALRRGDADPAHSGLSTAERDELLTRYLRPMPPVALAPVVLDYARATMDVSDGLVRDFDRLCRASNVCGVLEAASVPLSGAAATVVARDPAWLSTLLTAGDDYQVLATVPADKADAFAASASRIGVSVTRIGRIETADPSASNPSAPGARVIGPEGRQMRFGRAGYDHF